MKQGSKAETMTCEVAQRAIALAAMTGTDLLPEAWALSPEPGEEHPDASPASPQLNPLASIGSEALLLAHASLREAHPSRDAGGAESVAADALHRAELPAAERSAVQAHLRSCRACQAEAAATAAFFRALALDPGPEPSASLLARARLQLDESLDSCATTGFWTRLTRQMSFSMGRLRAAPALSSALLLCGLLAGGYGGYRAGHTAHMEEQNALLLAPPAPEVPSVVADVSSVSRDPGTGLVEVHYDRLVPDTMVASASDPSIRELLMAGTENGVNPHVRDISLNLLGGSSCGADSACSGAPVRNALMSALAGDKAPQVRREALAGLEPFIAQDTEVRDAVLAALMSDPSASVRAEAVHLLQPVDVDSSVRQVLNTVAFHDGDPVIRSASLAALRAVPQVQ